MLINFLIGLFTKFIWTPHRHNWEFERTYQTHTNVCGFTAERTEIVYKCTGCGKVILAPKVTWKQ